MRCNLTQGMGQSTIWSFGKNNRSVATDCGLYNEDVITKSQQIAERPRYSIFAFTTDGFLTVVVSFSARCFMTQWNHLDRFLLIREACRSTWRSRQVSLDHLLQPGFTNRGGQAETGERYGEDRTHTGEQILHLFSHCENPQRVNANKIKTNQSSQDVTRIYTKKVLLKGNSQPKQDSIPPSRRLRFHLHLLV